MLKQIQLKKRNGGDYRFVLFLLLFGLSFGQNTAPEFISVNSKSVKSQQPFNHIVKGNDTDNDLLTFSVSGELPSFLILHSRKEVSTFSTGMGSGSNPSGLVINNDGIMYQVNHGSGKLNKIDRFGTVTEFVSGLGNPIGLALDANGDIYVGETSDSKRRVVKIDKTTGAQTVISRDLHYPAGIAFDTSGKLYVTDHTNNLIYKMDSDGSNKEIFIENNEGIDGPYGITFGNDNFLYVASRKNHKIKKIALDGTITDVAGSVQGYEDNSNGSLAKFYFPAVLIHDQFGNLIVSDQNNHKLRLINTTGEVSTYAGSINGFADGNSSTAKFYHPNGLAVSKHNELFVSDFSNNRIRKIETIYTLSGTPEVSDEGNHSIALNVSDGIETTSQSFSLEVKSNTEPTVTTSPDLNGLSETLYTYSIETNDADADILSIKSNKELPAFLTLKTQAKLIASDNYTLRTPYGIAVASDGSKYIADSGNHLIKKVTPDGIMSVFVGSGVRGAVDGTGVNAQFNFPIRIAIDKYDNLFVTDYENHRIRKITPTGVVTTVAGSTKGYSDGTGSNAQFDNPYGIAIDSDGNMFIGDLLNNRVRKVTADGVVSTFAGDGSTNSTDGTGVAAQLHGPAGITIDKNGDIYFVEHYGNKVRKITTNAEVTTIAGSTVGDVDGNGVNAKFNALSDILVDNIANLFVSDMGSKKIKKVTYSGDVTSIISTNLPTGIAFDKNGNILHLDENRQTANTLGLSAQLEGTPSNSDKGKHYLSFAIKDGLDSLNHDYLLFIDDKNNAPEFTSSEITSAQYKQPYSYSVTALDSDKDNLKFSTDEDLPSFLNLDENKTTTTFAGTFGNSELNAPKDIGFDTLGNAYVTDYGNTEIKKIAANGTVTTLPNINALNFEGIVVARNGDIYLTARSSGIVYTYRNGEFSSYITLPDRPVSPYRLVLDHREEFLFLSFLEIL
jgi:sugar lactone lactonase YvrE